MSESRVLEIAMNPPKPHRIERTPSANTTSKSSPGDVEKPTSPGPADPRLSKRSLTIGTCSTDFWSTAPTWGPCGLVTALLTVRLHGGWRCPLATLGGTITRTFRASSQVNGSIDSTRSGWREAIDVSAKCVMTLPGGVRVFECHERGHDVGQAFGAGEALLRHRTRGERGRM